MTAAAQPFPVQRFPVRTDQGVVHKSWGVDLATAGRLHHMGERLRREVLDMAEHLPRWLLTISARGKLRKCSACKGVLVFDRGLRCVACERAVRVGSLKKNVRLAWFGLLPPIGLDSLGKIGPALAAKPPAHHAVSSRPDIGNFILVPLVAEYPTSFPRAPVEVFYLPSLFEVAGMPAMQASHEYHMLKGGMMCLFAPGQWQRESGGREVLQQRAYAHVIKLLNYANGKRKAFRKVS